MRAPRKALVSNMNVLKTLIKIGSRGLLRSLRRRAGAADHPDDLTARKISYGKSVLNNGPLPTNFSVNLGAAPCNHTCLFCPQSVEKPAKAEWLDLELLRKVLLEMPEENILLNLSSYSETITAPNLVPAVRLMKALRPKLPVAMATNGTIYREQVVEDLVDAGLDHYSYSFDGATKEQYRTLMQVDHFERAWENLERVVAIKRKKNSPMKITTHIMHFKGVEEAYEKFKAYWEDKLDAVVLRRVGNWGSDRLGLMKHLAGQGFVSAHETPAKRTPCPSIFMHFKLQYDGDYYPCVAAIPAYNEHQVPALGNARTMTWAEAWHKLGEMRRAHLEGRWDDYACCRSCNIWSMWDDMWFQDQGADGKPGPFHLIDIDHAR